MARTSAGGVSVVVEGPSSSPLLVLAPGAGADLDSDFMAAISSELVARGIRVARFNFVYHELGRRSPDRQPVLEATYREVISHLAEDHDGRLFLGGKSLGGRIASHLVASGQEADGLVFLGYPLHPPGRPERVRADHLGAVEVPMLFVEGTRDPLCPLPTLEAVRSRLWAPTDVAVIAEGDHSLRVRRSSGRTTAEAWAEAAEAVAGWLRRMS